MAADYLGSVSLAFFLKKVLQAFADARAALQILVGVEGALELSIMADLNAQVEAALDVGVDVQLVDPVAMLEGMLAAAASLSADLALITPDIFLQANVEASADVSVDVSAKAAAAASLFGALGTALASLGLALQLSLQLTSPGLHLFRYQGALVDLGAELDVVTPDAGLAPGDPVRAYALVVATGNAAASAELTAFFEPETAL